MLHMVHAHLVPQRPHSTAPLPTASFALMLVNKRVVILLYRKHYVILERAEKYNKAPCFSSSLNFSAIVCPSPTSKRTKITFQVFSLLIQKIWMHFMGKQSTPKKDFEQMIKTVLNSFFERGVPKRKSIFKGKWVYLLSQTQMNVWAVSSSRLFSTPKFP